jgi:hypothetical protein
MDMLFAIGQVIALGGLAYGAVLCITWRGEYDPEGMTSKRRAPRQPLRVVDSQGKYVAAAETDPAS